MNGSIEVFSIVYEANGCSADDEGYTVYRNRPSVSDSYGEEVNTWTVPEGATALFALYKRTARCCGSGRHFIAVDTDQTKLHQRAVELNLGVVQPEGLAMTDQEWQDYAESGRWPHPYGVLALEFEDSNLDLQVPEVRSLTDEEMATLPVLTLDEFEEAVFDMEPLGLSEDIFSEGVKES